MADATPLALECGSHNADHLWAEHGWGLGGQDLLCLLGAIAAASVLAACYAVFG